MSIASVLSLTLIAAAAPAHARKAVDLETDVFQILALASVPVERVRDRVPESFRIEGEEAERATVFVTIGNNPDLVLDGKPAPGRFGLVGVARTYPRDWEPADGNYDLWWSFSNPQFTRSWRHLGITSETVEGTHFDTDLGPTGGVVAVRASVPGGRSPFSMEATVLDARPPHQIEAPGFHWHEGPKGRVLGEHDNTEGEVLAAEVTITTEPGSPLAEILGASELTVPGLYLDFRLKALTYVVEGS